MSDQRNLLLAIVVSLAILLGFQFLVEERRPTQPDTGQTTEQGTPAPAAPGEAQVPAPAEAPGAPEAPAARQDVQPMPQGGSTAQVLQQAQRVPIRSPRLSGSVRLKGARLDDLTLTDYRQDVDSSSPPVRLLAPVGAENAYFAEFGWSTTSGVEVPTSETLWTAEGEALAPGRPLTLSWENAQGLRFVRVFSLDQDYMFTVTQRIENRSGEPVTLHPYGLISRHGTPQGLSALFILHEGLIGVFSETLEEIDYDDLQDARTISEQALNGWLGITDKYWLTTLVPEQGQAFAGSFRYLSDGQPRYQADYLRGAITVPAGGSAQVVDRLFAGAKEVHLLDAYAEQLGIPLFDRAVDFGWFYFLTKPVFYALDYFYDLLGNFGLAILLLTVLVKILFFPLANKSYRAMSKMKALQPEMLKIRDRFGSDRQRMNQEMMALYKREKVNPASGCLPIVIQIPVFFALYKVMYVTIEMRHAPFFGWIQDLSAPDPLTPLNLFGVIPWTPPDMIAIGIWPILMGLSMYLQQKLNPQPPDPVQAKVFLLMPVFFTFLLAQFPAGLVIYWTWNNVLSIGQQWIIMKRTSLSTQAKQASGGGS